MGKYLGRLDLEFLNGKMTVKNYRLIPVNLKKEQEVNGERVRTYIEKEIPEDPELLEYLRPYQEKGDASLRETLGFCDGLFEGDRAVIRKQQTNLGTLVTKAQQEKTRSDIAISNSGGIRDSLGKDGKKEISYKDVLIVHPFGNTLATVVLSGKELRDYLNVVLSKTPGSGAYPQVAGAVFTIQGGRITSVKIKGQEIQANTNYKLTVSNYLASGGDGYPELTGHPSYVNTGYNAAEALADYIRARTPLKTEDYKPANGIPGG